MASVGTGSRQSSATELAVFSILFIKYSGFCKSRMWDNIFWEKKKFPLRV